MNKWLLLCLCWPASLWGANVYNYFAPSQAGAASTCSANQIWTLNATGTLVVCTADFTYTASTATLQIGSSTAGQVDIVNPSAPANAHKTRTLVDSTGAYEIVPVNDAGTVTATDSLKISRSANLFTGFKYQDTFASLTATGGLFEFKDVASGSDLIVSGNDLKYISKANTQPALIVNDPGTGDALAGNIFFTGSGVGNELAEYCVSAAFSLGPGLTNGPANNYCLVSSGDQLFANAPSNAPLIFGSQGTFAGQIFAADQGWAFGAPTGGDKGTGTLNAQGVYSNGVQLKTVLAGTSASLGGGALLAGACASNTTSVAGSTTSMVAIADPNTYPGDGATWSAQVTSANTVTTRVCAIVALTPTASTYNLRVIQ